MIYKPNPQCQKHLDCFANKDGFCLLLTDNDFGQRDCSFYCNTADSLERRIAAAEKLKATGRTRLIERYYSGVSALNHMLWQDKVTLNNLR